MADGLDFEGVDLSGINFNIDATRNAANAAIVEAARMQQQAREAAQAEHEAEWEWREKQSELLGQVIEEQKRLAEGSEKSYKAALWAAIIAGVGILVSIALAAAPAVISIFAQ